MRDGVIWTGAKQLRAKLPGVGHREASGDNRYKR